MSVRRVLIVLAVTGLATAGTLTSRHTAFAAPKPKPVILSYLSYEIQGGGSDGSYFSVDGPLGRNYGTPVYGDFYCGGWYGDTSPYDGWTVKGTGVVKNYSSETQSENDRQGIGVLAVTFSDGSGDTVKISGGGVMDNYEDTMVRGSFKMVVRAADGDTVTCLQSPGYSAEGELENNL